tara:strand:+ start:5018 stop:5776 length:759 start_codon:yes stop_codon:yes gene_type:complete
MLSIEYNTTNIDFNKNNIISQIGEGSSGKIFKFNFYPYVIKILKNTNRIEYDFYKHFLNKLLHFDIISKFGYPIAYGNLTKPFNIFTNNNKFLILNLYKKLDISLIRGYTLSDKVLNLINQLLKIEVFLEKNIKCVNLDIKLTNLMMNRNNEIKIIDFGLIKEFNKGDMFYSYNNYYVWPTRRCYLDCVPLYSIFILICNIFIKISDIKKQNSLFLLKKLKYIIKSSPRLNIILNDLVSLKYDSNTLFKKIN